MFRNKMALYNPIEFIITGEERERIKESTNIIAGKKIDPIAPTKDL
jgi:hypothetical protein